MPATKKVHATSEELNAVSSSEDSAKISAESKKDGKPEPKPEPVVKEKKAWKSAEPAKPKAQPIKDVKLEITNPDDIDIDDKGQTKLF